MESTNLKCPNCGSELLFNAEGQNWRCNACGCQLSQDEVFKLTADSDHDIYQQSEKADDQPELNVYICQNCGAQLVTDDNTTATQCVYCGSVSIMKNRLEGRFRPDLIIPFETTRQDAIDAYNKFLRKKKLAPRQFANPENIGKITGVYIPFWLYNGHAMGSLSGEVHKSTSWRSGDYIYTKTDIYHIERAGSIKYEKVPVDGSKKFDDDTMDSIEPFDYEKFKPFNYSYLSGFLAEKYDVTSDESQERANLRMGNTLISSFLSTVDGKVMNMQEDKNINISDIKYALLPVWMLNTHFKGQTYPFAMNGQTGRLVGNVPIDKVKAWLFFLKATLIALALLCIISWLFFM